MSENFMICLKKLSDSGETCCNSLFQVKKTNSGLIAICTNCNAEHLLKEGVNWSVGINVEI
ncbi:hypothetical protein C0971_15830 [Bacillus methanolicus]|uniref:hypothetical protein n=1 Tax=Bacillus methanolicus TaxID=1471 RepID=UPI00200E2C43|nr:hypothetical protein [Bacillus methanolicus]UQD53324.1 hypothetical protein C0971_15830 [Bacillus methanolicus]